MATQRNHYEILGVSPQASEKDIKAAYRKRAKETHPDFGGAIEEAAAVNTAADVLLDPLKRADYDRQLSQARARGAASGPAWSWEASRTSTPPRPPVDTLTECPHCGAKNRVKPGALAEARCGACKKPLKDSLGQIFSDWRAEFSTGGLFKGGVKAVDDMLAKAEAKLRETREAMDRAEEPPTDAYQRAQRKLDEMDEWERKLGDR